MECESTPRKLEMRFTPYVACMALNSSRNRFVGRSHFTEGSMRRALMHLDGCVDDIELFGDQGFVVIGRHHRPGGGRGTDHRRRLHKARRSEIGRTAPGDRPLDRWRIDRTASRDPVSSFPSPLFDLPLSPCRARLSPRHWPGPKWRRLDRGQRIGRRPALVLIIRSSEVGLSPPPGRWTGGPPARLIGGEPRRTRWRFPCISVSVI